MNEAQAWAEADDYLRRFGGEAAIFAAQRADELLEEGDIDGAGHWCRVVHCISALLERPSGRLH